MFFWVFVSICETHKVQLTLSLQEWKRNTVSIFSCKFGTSRSTRKIFADSTDDVGGVDTDNFL